MSEVRFRRQPNWYIDGENLSGLASDRNDGHDITHPIRHWETMFRRLGPRAYIHDLAMTINVMSSLQSGDFAVLDMLIGKNSNIAVLGTKKTAGLPVGTITTAVDVNRTVGAETMPKITDTALGAGGFSTAIGKLVKITGGVRSGTSFFTMKDLTAKTARITTPMLLSASSGPLGATRKVLVNGDPYQVYDLPNVPLGLFHIECASNQNNPSFTNWFTCNSILIDHNISSEIATVGSYIGIGDCILSGTFIQSDFWASYNTLYTPASIGGFGGIGIENCASFACIGGGILNGGMFATSSAIVFDLDFLFQAMPSVCGLLGGCQITTGTCAFFDGTSGLGLLAIPTGCRWDSVTYSESEQLWGTNNNGCAVRVSGGHLKYGVLPTINKGLGMGREIRVGATEKTWAEMPYTETLNGSYVGLTEF
jgi:hypothetical protein